MVGVDRRRPKLISRSDCMRACWRPDPCLLRPPGGTEEDAPPFGVGVAEGVDDAESAGGGVVPVPAETSAIRVYAHCTTKGARTAAGSVTVLTINLGGTPTALHLPAAALVAVEEYVLTPSPAAAGSLSGVGGLMGTGPLSRFRPPGTVLGAQEMLTKYVLS